MSWPRALTCAVALSAAAAWAISGLLLASWPDAGIAGPLVTGAVALPSLLLGGAIAVRRPENRIAPLLCSLGAVPVVVVGLGDLYATVVRLHPGALPVPPLYAGLSQGMWMLLYLPAALLMLLFPDGRLPGPRWRGVLVGLLAVPVAFSGVAATLPEPYPPPFQDTPHALGTVPAGFRVLGAALLLVFAGLLAASAAAMVVRYRRATDPVRRAQLRWFALGGTLVPLTLLTCWVSYWVWDGPDLVVVGLAVCALAVPAATAVALLRHDLYDVDRAFSSTVTYGLVTAVLLAVFAGATALSGVALGRDSAPTAAAATALCALALAPVRTRVQRRVDRRLYPRRDALRTSLEALRRAVDAGRARPEDLEAALRTALGDPGLRVGYLLPGRADPVDAAGRPLPGQEERRRTVALGDVPVGVLVPGTAAVSRQLLGEAAARSAVLVELTRSRLQIAEALREVEDSRARLLRAGYEERRRLQRDLHDGAQQRLVSLGMALRLAQRHLGEPSVDLDGVIDQAVAELGTAVAELRTIASGLRPAALDSGLASALESLVATVPIPVRLQACPEPVPDVVATTAYYVATEALTNAVKHAGAEQIDLRVLRENGHVRVRISDDGCGGARPRPGSGLAGLVDRVAAAGGSLTVGDTTPRGTVVEAVLPCAR